VKLSPLLLQISFDFFALESEPPQVKLVNAKGISFKMSYNEYIEIFNRLMNAGRIVHLLEYLLNLSTTLVYSTRVGLLAQ